MQMHIVFDLETSGLPIMRNRNEYFNYSIIDKYNNSRIVQIAYMAIDNDYNILYSKEFKVKDVDLRDSTKFHNITQQDIQESGKDFDAIVDELMSDFKESTSLIAHNISFDINVLCSELYRRGYKEFASMIIKKPIVCTMLRLKNIINVTNSYGVKYPSLADLYRFAFGSEACIENAHNAHYDVLALIQSLKEIKEVKDICVLKICGII